MRSRDDWIVGSPAHEGMDPGSDFLRDDTPEFAGWTVVDFKTDREFEETSDRYIVKVRVYSQAVGAATNSPARGVLLVV